MRSKRLHIHIDTTIMLIERLFYKCFARSAFLFFYPYRFIFRLFVGILLACKAFLLACRLF